VSHIREIIQTDTGLQEVVTFAPPDAEIEFVDGEEQETVQLEDDTCEECSLVCQKERNPPCKHPCTLPCHLNDCPPCKTPVKKPCHCKSIRITVECHKTHDQELMKTLLCCGQICQKTLPACTHTCLSVCHFSACAAECKRKVNVRCTCNRIKQRWICDQAQEVRAMKKLKNDATILIDCDKECEKEKEDKRQNLLEEKMKAEQEANNAKVQEESTGYKKRNKKERVEKKNVEASMVWQLFLGLAVFLLLCIALVFIRLKLSETQ